MKFCSAETKLQCFQSKSKRKQGKQIQMAERHACCEELEEIHLFPRRIPLKHLQRVSLGVSQSWCSKALQGLQGLKDAIFFFCVATLFQNLAGDLRGLHEKIYNLLPSLEIKKWSYLEQVLFIKKNRFQVSDKH